MNNDGLVDLAVGSLGAAVLLWLVFHSVNDTVVKDIKDISFDLICDTCMPSQVAECCPDIYHHQV